MRSTLLSFLCVAFAVYGSLVPSAHARAHAELDHVPGIASHSHHDHHSHDLDVSHDADHDSDADDEDEGPMNSHITGGHGSELHFSAVFNAPVVSTFIALDTTDNQMGQYSMPPSPLIAPDPDPDRI